MTEKKEPPFVVRENKGLLRVVGVLLLVCSNAAFFGVRSTDGSLGYLLVGITFLLPGVLCFWRASAANRAIMQIDETGFSYYGRRLTTWDEFEKAWYMQEALGDSIADKFVLMLRYRKADGRVYQRRLPLTNTQDKAEEEIIAAIRRFYQRHCNSQAAF